MSDVNNPGQVSVEGETYNNPNPNNDSVLFVPEQLDTLTNIGKQGYPRADNDVEANAFPTPAEIAVTQVPTGQVVQSSVVPPAANIIVDDQIIGQGAWVYVDPLNPAAGKRFVTPGEFLVVGPADSIQTNNSEATTVLCTITAVYDADNLWNAPTPTTTRFVLVVGPPALTSYPISILGRQIVFADDTLTAEIAGAVRFITGFSTNYLVVDGANPSDPNVPNLMIQTVPPPPPPGTYVYPQAGDTFTLDVQRQGSEDISRTGQPTIDVVILPPPLADVPNPSQAQNNQGTINVSVGPQPGRPIITSGASAPTAINVNVADQATSVGLPANVMI
jgi:hypothetical protein